MRQDRLDRHRLSGIIHTASHHESIASASDIPPVITPTPPVALKPVAAEERIETLDVLRGFALFGILTVNMAGFSWPMDQVLMGRSLWESRADLIADGIVGFLAEGKFYPLFSFLFGLGVALQMERAEARGAEFAGRFCRRLLVLLSFGLAHAILVWEGDILVWYALCGFLLLAFRKRKPSTLLIWVAVCLLIPALLILALWAMLAGASLVPEISQIIQRELAQDSEASARQLEESIRVFARGRYGEILAERFGNLLFMWMIGIFFVPTCFAMFLLGLYAGQRRIFQNIEENVGRFRRLLFWGLALGIPANLLYTFGNNLSDISDVYFLWLLSSAVLAIGGPTLGLTYAAGLTLLLRAGVWKRASRPVAAAGRMALSNYLFQSLICTTLFYSYGFGLFGSVGRAAGLVFVGVIYLAQVAFSAAWLKHFQFGPMEWLWRSLTYGTRQPMRP